MFLSHLHLKNFRNITSLSLELEPKAGLTIVQGNNAQGKTNLLEAISLLSIPSPLRSRSLPDCIQFEKDYLDIQAQFTNHALLEDLESVFENYSVPKHLRLFYQRPAKKAMFHNQVEVKSKDFVGHLKAVIFTPEDIELLSHSPSLRRRYIDRLLVQTDPEYFYNLAQYGKVLKSRNLVLKDEANHATIGSYDLLLSKYAFKVWTARSKVYQFLNRHLQDFYTQIADEKVQINLEVKDSKLADQLSEKAIYEKLQSNLKRDQITKYTHFGPHRDDFTLFKDQQPIKDFGSRGERRSMVIALKIAELEYLKSTSLFTPILLLDDVFSELDAPRRYKLLNLASDYQTLITTVENSYFQDLDQTNYQLLKLEDGQLL